jgi:hypothetical protein
MCKKIQNCVILIRELLGMKRILFTDENQIMVTVNKAGIKGFEYSFKQWVGLLCVD